MKPEVNKVYSFTNKMNYTTTIKITRLTDKSIFYQSLLKDGKYSNMEFRISYNSFAGYTEVN